VIVLAAGLVASALFASSASAGGRRSVLVGQVRVWKISYRAHNGARRNAYVALPRTYRPGSAPPIPLVISPHGRGLSGRENLKLWGQMPAIGGFGVISPDGQGRLLQNYSWGATGQISDLARMPQIVHATMPWVHVDAHRVYALGGSMGGQETLLLAAKHPKLLAGAAAFDPVVDFSLQYREFPQIGCKAACRKQWNGPMGRSLQALARSEIGGSPSKAKLAYELRSPLTYARALAFSPVPLQIWWSPRDKIVIDQQRQAARLVHLIRQLNPKTDLIGFTGGWRHSAEMRAKTRLPLALAIFGLLPSSYGRVAGLTVVGCTPLTASAPEPMEPPKRELL
jgi:pimeloyl-ACP methyl ester carboxylesterase